MVKYKGGLIRVGSHAYVLWELKQWAALDKHLAEVQQAARKRGEVR